MSQMVIARRYASALSNLAQKENSLEQVENELKDFADTLHESVKLQEGLSNNKVPMAVRNNILTDVLTSMNLSPLVSTFLRYLLSKRRLSLVRVAAAAAHARLHNLPQISAHAADDALGRSTRCCPRRPSCNVRRP